MNIIINASDLKAGGGLQVADSICCELDKYPQHHFVVVLSTYLQKTAERIADYENVETIFYNYNNNLHVIFQITMTKILFCLIIK